MRIEIPELPLTTEQRTQLLADINTNIEGYVPNYEWEFELQTTLRALAYFIANPIVSEPPEEP